MSMITVMTAFLRSCRNRFSRAKRSLKSAIILGIALGILLPALVVGPILALDSYRREVDQRVHALQQQYGTMLEQTMPGPVWHVDKQAAQTFIDSVMLNPDVINITIEDASLGRFLSTEKPERRAGTVVRQTRRLVWNEKLIGRAHIEMSTAFVERQFLINTFKVAAGLLLQLAISFFLLLLLFERRVMRPLRTLQDDAQRLAQNDLIHSVHILRDDEMGDLASTLEQMRDKLNHYIEQIREFSATLEHKVEERTEALNQANQGLMDALTHLKTAQDEIQRSERMAALGSLVAGVAHELNTPIGNSITVASTLQDLVRQFKLLMATGLKRSDLDNYLENTQKAADMLIRNLHNAGELIGSFKQVAVDRTSAKRRQFDLDEVIAEIIITMAPGMKRSTHHIESRIPPRIRLDSYPGPLGQIISNLINNALLHGFEHQIDGTITISATALLGHQVEIIIADNGCGIPDTHQKRIFDPFFTTKLGRGGSGLGLNIVYNLTTHVLGGTIRVESEHERGTRFILVIPFVAPEASVVEPI